MRATYKVTRDGVVVGVRLPVRVALVLVREHIRASPLSCMRMRVDGWRR